MKPLGLYVHIPFCVKKCNYCDFLSAPATKEVQECYVDALCKEIEAYREKCLEHEVKTVYFGGGTPSVLDTGLLKKLMGTIQKNFVLDEAAEVTMEINPGTVTKEKLVGYHELGVNRLSIGVQSAKDEELKLLGRIHTFEDAKNTVKWAREAGFDNLSLDLISALPKQTKKDYEENVEAILSLKPEHISSYSLIVEEQTPFYEWYGEGKEKEDELPDEEVDRSMYSYTKERLQAAGYERYEISNYAKTGYESRHNSSYWTGQEYIGVGLGASSYFGSVRYHNEEELLTYIEEVNGEADIHRNQEKLDMTDCMEEYMILGLRRMCGVSKEDFLHRFGKPIESVYGEELLQLEKEGLLSVAGDRIALTEFGIDVSNRVFVEFLKK